MAVTQSINLDGRDVPFKASAATPRIYRQRYGRDIFVDLQKLMDAVDSGDPNHSMLDLASLELFEDIAYLMAKEADPAVPDTPEAWLDGFTMFSIYSVLPQILALWGVNVETQVDAKKNDVQPTDR